MVRHEVISIHCVVYFKTEEASKKPLSYGVVCTGYMTTTQIIFLLVVQDNGTAMDETIKRLCITLHRYYVEYILNPFTPISTSTKTIESKQFHSKVQEYIESFNNNLSLAR